MALAGAVNLAMVVLAAAALKGSGADSLDAAHIAIGDRLGQLPALLFALALLASGFASSSVGTYAGSVILDGFWQRRVPLAARRLITLSRPCWSLRSASTPAGHWSFPRSC